MLPNAPESRGSKGEKAAKPFLFSTTKYQAQAGFLLSKQSG